MFHTITSQSNLRSDLMDPKKRRIKRASDIDYNPKETMNEDINSNKEAVYDEEFHSEYDIDIDIAKHPRYDYEIGKEQEPTQKKHKHNPTSEEVGYTLNDVYAYSNDNFNNDPTEPLE